MPKPAPAHAEASAVQRARLAWVLRLRWAAILAQLSTALLAELAVHIALPLATVSSIILFEAASNVALWRWRRGQGTLAASLLAALLALDILLLTLLLLFTGGRLNPFSCLYLVHIALGAVLLPLPLMCLLIGWSLACFGLLSVEPSWWQPPAALNHLAHRPAQMHLHMEATWCAFAVSACFISHFVMRMRQRLAQRELELSRARALAVQSEKLVSLATLATGAAHELSTPLATIAIAAKELERSLSERDAEPREVARSIRCEVERCRQILQHMVVAAGSSAE
jgi:two-component system sensor histidine kinase RegB